ncbi:MAG: hypothetical protein VR78_01265 [Hoeflea sp. BRH_c9]|nr:MAG: hypothetical protein VR78_01265 [Hoeflea sp. BRH_c9]
MRVDEFDLEQREKAPIAPSPGKCIYCYEILPPEELTDEHVIPYALAADTLIFEKSCCTVCQKEITRYEQNVLRHQLGAFRAQVDAPTRKKKDRIREVVIHFIEVDDEANKIRDLGERTIPIERAPLIINLWQSPPARILEETVSRPDQPWTYFVESEVNALNKQVREETGANHVAMSLGNVNKVKYQRFLAKTAHAFVSAKIGPDAFEPFLTDIILNRSDDVGLYVGDMPGVHEFAENPENTLQMSMGRLTTGPAAGSIAVYFQLYPSIKSPAHVIIVGKPLVDLDLVFPEA